MSRLDEPITKDFLYGMLVGVALTALFIVLTLAGLRFI